jgi:N-acyl-L-homoserine lactone synthetase
MGQEALQYNPPFVYCMTAFTTRAGSRQIVVGLGNGMMLRFKRKGMEIQEISGETGHGEQIAAVIIDQGRMVTAG